MQVIDSGGEVFITFQYPVKTMDADLLGELLRKEAFVTEEPYQISDMQARPDAVPLRDGEIFKFFGEDPWLEQESLHGFSWLMGPLGQLRISCFWYWDGDGHLAFEIYDGRDSKIREIHNTDCKKVYGWREHA